MPSSPKRGTDAWREALKIISRCPVCSTAYLPEDAHIFAREESATLLHIACRECSSFFVAMVVLVGAGVSSVGMVTDLNFSDMQRIHSTGAISIDEIIEGHLAIEQQNFITKVVS